MKKYILLTIVLLTLLCGCKNNNIEIIDEQVDNTEKILEIIDETKNGEIPTGSALELFWQDDKYEYYFPSIKSQYVNVKTEDGNMINVIDALEEGLINIEDLDEFDIGYYKKEIGNDSFETPNDEYSFFAKVIESNMRNIIVEPFEDESIRRSSDKISIGLGEYNDALYMVGTNLKITFNGDIIETYPAQINATKIELKSVDEFKIFFEPDTTDSKKEVILSKGEVFDVPNYNVYAVGGNVNISLDGKEFVSLRDALVQGKITINEIIKKANIDVDNNTIKWDMLKDGGTRIYKYDGYTIIKYHTLDGNRDVYFGGKDLKISDIK